MKSSSWTFSVTALSVLVMLLLPMGFVVADQPASSQPGFGDILKSASKAAGETAGQALMQKMSPQARAVVDQAQALPAGAKQENFLVTKAREYMAANNYQPALDLASYVVTMVNSKSIDAKKIMADAQAALTKVAQDKMNQAKTTATANKSVTDKTATAQQVSNDAARTVNGLKGLWGATK